MGKEIVGDGIIELATHGRARIALLLACGDGGLSHRRRRLRRRSRSEISPPGGYGL